jgi:hypothetical protein
MAALSTSQEPCKEEDAEALHANESMLYMPGSDQQIPAVVCSCIFFVSTEGPWRQ